MRPALDDGVDGGFDKVIIDGNLKLHLPQQIHREFPPSIDFGLALLPPKSLAIHDGEAEYLHVGERFLDRLEATGLDDGNNEFHVGRVKQEPFRTCNSQFIAITKCQQAGRDILTTSPTKMAPRLRCARRTLIQAQGALLRPKIKLDSLPNSVDRRACRAR